VLDLLVQARRDKRAAVTSRRNPLKGRHGIPCMLITDKLASDGATKEAVLPGVEHRQPLPGCGRGGTGSSPTMVMTMSLARPDRMDGEVLSGALCFGYGTGTRLI